MVLCELNICHNTRHTLVWLFGLFSGEFGGHPCKSSTLCQGTLSLTKIFHMFLYFQWTTFFWNDCGLNHRCFLVQMANTSGHWPIPRHPLRVVIRILWATKNGEVCIWVVLYAIFNLPHVCFCLCHFAAIAQKQEDDPLTEEVKQGKCVVVQVYENQRFVPGQGWSDRNLLILTDRPAWSDQVWNMGLIVSNYTWVW